MNEGKTIIDPVFGFIHVPKGLLLDILLHPLFQRLARIKQLGLANEVYPGAQHTRFQHSLGAYFLMTQALANLRSRGVDITDDECRAAQAAILLHDIGHGPFSHALEHSLTRGVSHEDMSLLIMQQINRETGGKLDMAISIFRDNYSKRFLHELICSQLDVDRLDYLCRDSFFTGVREGNIGSARIIDMLDVADDRIVVRSKGLYSVENYLVTRRLMYWQVYFHKTAIAAEMVLNGALRRARWLTAQGQAVECSPALQYFLGQDVGLERFKSDNEALRAYTALDDYDIWTALKAWCGHKDKVLRTLARDFVDRRLFKVEISDTVPSRQAIDERRKLIAQEFGFDSDELDYFVSWREIEKPMYSNQADAIRLLFPDGTIRTMPQVSDIIASDTGWHHDRKIYFCYQRT